MNDNQINIAETQAHLEKEKLRSEINKLNVEIVLAKKQNKRAFFTSLSIIVAIVVSIIGGWETLSSISAKNREIELKTRVDTTEIFLEKILPKIQGSDSQSKESVKYGAYLTAVSLANEFPKLKNSVKAVLQKNAENGDNNANEALKLLK